MEDELFEAELFDEAPLEERREKRQLNGAMGATLAIVVLFLILAATVGIPSNMMGADAGNSHWLPPVEERSGKLYDNSDVFSRVSWNGSHNISAVQSIFVDVPAITLSDGGAGATGCLLYTSPSPRDRSLSRMPSSA